MFAGATMTVSNLSAVQSDNFDKNSGLARDLSAPAAIIFDNLTPALQTATPLRAAITAAYRKSEPAALADLLPQATPPAAITQAGDALALELAKKPPTTRPP